MYWNLFEPLESRQFLSVSAATLVGPLVKGSVWIYTTGATTTTTTLIGSAKFQNHAALRFDTKNVTNNITTITSGYQIIDKSKAFVHYGSTGSASGGAVKSTLTFAPEKTLYPASLSAGKTYTFKTTLKAATVVSGHSSTSTTAETDTIKLVSEKTAKVTVPAGTFSCYTIKTTIVQKTAGQSSTVNSTLYVSPAVGVVKSVSVVTGHTVTNVLKKYTKGR